MPSIRHVDFTPTQIKELAVARRATDVHLSLWDRFWDRFRNLFHGVTKREVVEGLIEELGRALPEKGDRFSCTLDRLEAFHRLAMLAKADERGQFTTAISEPAYSPDRNSCTWQLSLKVGGETVDIYQHTETSSLKSYKRAVGLQAVYAAARHAGIDVDEGKALFLDFTAAEKDDGSDPIEPLKAHLAETWLAVWNDPGRREATIAAWETMTGQSLDRKMPAFEQLVALGCPLKDKSIAALCTAGVELRGIHVQRLLDLGVALRSHRGDVPTKAPLRALLELGIHVHGIDIDTLASHGIHVKGMTASELDDLGVIVRDRSIRKLYEHAIDLPGATLEQLVDVSLEPAGSHLATLATMGVAVKGAHLTDLQRLGVVVEHLSLAQLLDEYGVNVDGMSLLAILECGVNVKGIDARTLLDQNIGLRGISVIQLAQLGVVLKDVRLNHLLDGGLDNLKWQKLGGLKALSLDLSDTTITQLAAAGFPYENVPIDTFFQYGIRVTETPEQLMQLYKGKMKVPR